MVKRWGDFAMGPSVDDYRALLARAACVLSEDGAEARRELYERARAALKVEFGKLDPRPSAVELLKEQIKLDFAIHDFEWSATNEIPYAKSA
jgi:hypothetical protein